MSWVKNKRNKKWSKKLGWEPEDFGCKTFNRQLEIAITFFQKERDFPEIDGVCGPYTYRILTGGDSKRAAPLVPFSENNGTSLLVNDQWIDIGWPTRWQPLPNNCFKKVKKDREPTCVVVHHDATTSADRCHTILEKIGISTHLCIDNDGTIVQYVDLNDICWHAGVSYWRKRGSRTKVSSRKLNKVSIGVDFSNAWYTKYNKTYKKMGFEKRDVVRNSYIHGIKMKPHLDMYPIQIQSFKVLARFLEKRFSIPLVVPRKGLNFIRGWVKECMKGNFVGFQCHFNSSINKIDTDIPLGSILDGIILEDRGWLKSGWRALAEIIQTDARAEARDWENIG
jgi:hypothetical protein